MEVLSSSTRHRDLGIKADRYLANGISEYWLVDLEFQKIEVWQNKKTFWEKGTGDTLEITILNGLVVHSKDIFN